ncbi:MAG: epoxide hydrolase family protein [Acidimicrobiales bacterium]
MGTDHDALTLDDLRFEVTDEALADLRRRLDDTRWPDHPPGEPWSRGTHPATLRRVVDHWRTDYDWRRLEGELAAYRNVVTELDGERVHVLIAESPRPDAVPLLLTHGWPGSIVEFLDILPLLTDPGDDTVPAFEVVCPSLPGFGFSGPTSSEGVHPRRIAGMWIELMAGLGHDRYLAQGGDWGSVITSFVGALDPEHCAGIHLNMVVTRPTEEDLADLSAEEQQYLTEAAHFLDDGNGYFQLQSTKPQTLAYGLTDSPAGLCGWILEKFWAWCDTDGSVFDAVSIDRFLDNVSLYWLTNTAGSAARIYHEYKRDGSTGPKTVEVPMGGAIFPVEIYKSSRRWAERRFDVVHWSELDRGGHFAAMEEPDLLAAELRAFAGATGSA